MERRIPGDQLAGAQIDLLIRNLARGTFVSHVTGAAVAIFLMLPFAPLPLLAAWGGVLLSVLMARGWHMRRCLASGAHETAPHRVRNQLIAGISVVGLTWVAGFVYASTVAPVNVQYLLLLVIVLIATLALGVSVVVREYFVAYLCTSLLPIGVWQLINVGGHPHGVITGLVLLASCAVLALICNASYLSYRNLMRVNWEKDRLVQESSALAGRLRDRNKELTEARQRLAEQARIDELTGLFNRRALNERLDAEVKRCARAGTPLAVIMLDVDHFKNFNDNYGHQAGDEVLAKLALVLREAANRAGDIVARFGGEEFILVLPAADVMAARAVAVRIQQALRQEAIPHAYSPVADTLTVSQGLAYARPEEGLTSSEIISRADAALYEAKAAGRDAIKAA